MVGSSKRPLNLRVWVPTVSFSFRHHFYQHPITQPTITEDTLKLSQRQSKQCSLERIWTYNHPGQKAQAPEEKSGQTASVWSKVNTTICVPNRPRGHHSREGAGWRSPLWRCTEEDLFWITNSTITDILSFVNTMLIKAEIHPLKYVLFISHTINKWNYSNTLNGLLWACLAWFYFQSEHLALNRYIEVWLRCKSLNQDLIQLRSYIKYLPPAVKELHSYSIICVLWTQLVLQQTERRT